MFLHVNSYLIFGLNQKNVISENVTLRHDIKDLRYNERRIITKTL